MNRELHTLEMDRRVHEVREPDQHGSQPDQAVQYGDELRHFGHLHPSRQRQADRAAEQQGCHEFHVVLGDDTEYGRNQRDQHADDAVPVATA